MKQRLPFHHRRYVTLAFLALFAASAVDCGAEENQIGSLWTQLGHQTNSVESSSIHLGKIGGVSIGIQQSEEIYRSPATEQNLINAQGLTFSYQATAGLLGLSAGYLYSPLRQAVEEIHYDPNIRTTEQDIFDQEKTWYMALDLSRNYRVSEDVSLGMATRSMIFNTPFEDKKGKTFSLLFNLPISYKKHFIITPELQWYRSIYDNNTATADFPPESDREQDSFYGGVSISFSY